MKKAKFESSFLYRNYVEETADGELVEHSKFWTKPVEIVAEIVEERQHTYKLELFSGRRIIKKKRQVEVM